MTVETTSAFDAFMNDIDGLHKAMPEVAEYEDSDEDKEEDAEGDAKIKQAAEAGAGKPMAKAMQVTLADGSTVEAFDGAEMIKSLQDQVGGLEGGFAKALSATAELLKRQGDHLVAQDKMIKSLTAKVSALGAAPAGRKSTLVVHEKPSGTLAKSQSNGITTEEFMAKADAAFAAGSITGQELINIDTCNRHQKPIPQDLIARVIK